MGEEPWRWKEGKGLHQDRIEGGYTDDMKFRKNRKMVGKHQ